MVRNIWNQYALKSLRQGNLKENRSKAQATDTTLSSKEAKVNQLENVRVEGAQSFHCHFRGGGKGKHLLESFPGIRQLTSCENESFVCMPVCL